MIALARFFLFGSVYLTLLILSGIASASNEFFSMITFLVTTVCLGGWLYYLHFVEIEPSKGLKEILYVTIYVTLFTTIWACFNIYVETDLFIHNVD